MHVRGLFTALITPYTSEGFVDYSALAKLIKDQDQAGVSGFVVCGSTGEGALLTQAERSEAIKIAKQSTHKPVIAGCGSPATHVVIEQAQQAEHAGADGLLVVTPFYSRPQLAGVQAHFAAVTAATSLPIIIYNNPGRTGIDLPVTFVRNLFDSYSRIIGIKDSTLDTSRMAEFAATHATHALLCGDDPFITASYAQGANGCVSIASNALAPELVQLIGYIKQNQMTAAQHLNQQLMPMHKLLVEETNPAPIKGLMSAMAMCRSDTRLPLVPASPDLCARLIAQLSFMRSSSQPMAMSL